MELLFFLWQCFKVYRKSKKGCGDVAYFAWTWRGVPRLSVVIGMNREAWQVSQFASNYFIMKGKNTDISG